ncbi:MAG: GGDEF domain-containing protein [Gemmatimonadetes bacterium]|nr:GGDEF domain-containing protein [Gemmatimonadota bacterium]
MSAAHTFSLIQLIGLWTQLGATALLVGLFVVMRRYSPRRTYFSTWGEAWGALCAAVGAIVVETLYQMAPPALVAETGGVDSPVIRSLLGLSAFGRLLFLALLVAGTAMYTRGFNHARFFRIVTPLAALWSALAVGGGEGTAHIMRWLAAPAVAAYVACAWFLVTLPTGRAGLGTRLTGAVFASHAMLWVAYAAAYGAFPFIHPTPGSFWAELATYHGYVDLLALMLLGFGMMVIQLEDARREVDDARAELSVTNDRLRRMALYDPLTGCLNRRAYDEGIGLEFAKSTFGTVVMLDMDNLKWVNDQYGHAVGDELLAYFAGVLREQIRPLDRLYRWGGDEFLLVMPGAKVDGVAGRLAAVIEAAPPLALSPAHGGEHVPLALSLGAESYSSADQLPQTIERADATMYADKRLRKRTMTPANIPTVR